MDEFKSNQKWDVPDYPTATLKLPRLDNLEQEVKAMRDNMYTMITNLTMCVTELEERIKKLENSKDK